MWLHVNSSVEKNTTPVLLSIAFAIAIAHCEAVLPYKEQAKDVASLNL